MLTSSSWTPHRHLGEVRLLAAPEQWDQVAPLKGKQAERKTPGSSPICRIPSTRWMTMEDHFHGVGLLVEEDRVERDCYPFIVARKWGTG
jgi:hypothetical protein